MKYFFFFPCFLFSFSSICPAQKYGVEKADSLLVVLKKENTDTVRVKMLTDISIALYCHNNIKGLGYAEQALNLSNKTGYKKGTGLAFYAAGVNYIFRGDFAKSIDNLMKAKSILETIADNILIARCNMQIANAHLFVMHSDTAYSYVNKAIQVFTKMNDSIGLANAYGTKGLIYQYAGSYDTAIIWFEKGLAISRKKGEEDLSGLLMADLGSTYAGMNNYSKSLAYSFDAIILLEKINGGYLAVPYGNIAYLYLLTKDYARAKSYAQNAAKVAEKQYDDYRLAASLNMLGGICVEEKNYSCALNSFRPAMELMKKINNPGEIALCYGSLGDTYRKLGDYTSALDYLFVALQMTHELNDTWHENYYLYTIGNVYLQLYNKQPGELPRHPQIPRNKFALLPKAGDYFAKAKTMALQAGDMDDMVLILKDISDLKLLQGDPVGALKAYKESVLYGDSVNNLAKSKDLARKELEYEYSKQQDSIKLVNDQKDILNKARYALQQKATEGQRRYKRLAGMGVIILLLVTAFIYFLFLQRRKLSNQLAVSLSTLKDAQEQLIRIEKEKEGEKVRQGISRDLHDNLGSTLSGIAMYSHMMDKQLKSGNYENAKTSISVIQKSANEVVGKLSDLVWSANAGQDSLKQLLERLQQYGLEMCIAKNIQFNMNNVVPGKTFYLPPEHRYYIYLVAKEAINNAVKYSNASLLELKVNETAGVLKITICDNGIGFMMDEIKKGNGLDNMEKRMLEIGATYRLYAKPGDGCIVSIQLNIT